MKTLQNVASKLYNTARYRTIGRGIYIDGRARIGSGVKIDNSVRIFGPSNISNNSIIGFASFIGLAEMVNEELTSIPSFNRRSRGAIIGKGSHIAPNTIIGDNNRIGNEFSTGFGPAAYVGVNNVIGKGVSLVHGAQVLNECEIGDDCFISGYLGERSVLGDRVTMHGNLIHKYFYPNEKRPYQNKVEPAPVIKDDAIIGFGAQIVGGVNIGEHAYVAAGAVVVEDVEPYTMVAGVPARRIGRSD